MGKKFNKLANFHNHIFSLLIWSYQFEFCVTLISVHEGTLVHALSMLALWCAKFSTDVPQKIIEWFKVSILHTIYTSTMFHYMYLWQNAEFLHSLGDSSVFEVLLLNWNNICNTSNDICNTIASKLILRT